MPVLSPLSPALSPEAGSNPADAAAEPLASLQPRDQLAALPGQASVRHHLALVDPPAGQGPAHPVWSFTPSAVRGTYAAGGEKTPTYDFRQIIKDIPAIWDRPWSRDMASQQAARGGETYGELFKRVGSELGVDPYALAAYCVFESYNSNRHSFNPGMKDVAGGMHAAGIAATQAQDWKGRTVPGLGQKFPRTISGTASLLRQKPEFALRCLAEEFRTAYAQNGQDLARAFPKVAYPAWGSPSRTRGAYGNLPQYVSRAHAVYQAFKAADKP